jgi:hypothetical protein
MSDRHLSSAATVIPTAAATAAAVDDDGWAHRIQTWASTAPSTARSDDREDHPMPIDDFHPANGWMPDPERMSEAAESLLQACRMIYEAYADAYRQALPPGMAPPKTMTMPGAFDSMAMMPGAFDWQAFGLPDEIREAGKQFGLAYIEAADSCISAARRMLT